LLSITLAYSQNLNSAILGQWTNTEVIFINITSDSAIKVLMKLEGWG